MSEKIVSFELQYYVSKQKEAKKCLLERKFDEVIKILKEPIEKIDEVCKGDIYCPQNVFEAAVCLNYLEKEVHQNSFSKINFYDLYLMMGASHYNLENYSEAQRYYTMAIKLDPVSSIARQFSIDINLKVNNLDDILSSIQDAMFFAYTREDIAQIYKLTGDFLRIQKDYEMSIVAYFLSNVYTINSEIIKLAKKSAHEENIEINSEEWLSEGYMKKFHNTYKIPLLPNQKLYELAKAMGEDAYNKKQFTIARNSYQLAYNLMLDEELKPILDELSRK